jgi:hypothetical protein
MDLKTLFFVWIERPHLGDLWRAKACLFRSIQIASELRLPGGSGKFSASSITLETVYHLPM